MSDAISYDHQNKILFCAGEWNLQHISTLYEISKQNSSIFSNNITIDGRNITKMDSSGAWLLSNGIKSLVKHNINISYKNFSEQHQKILALTESQNGNQPQIPEEQELSLIQQLGKYGIIEAKELIQYFNFLGILFFESMRIIFNPHAWRINTIATVVISSGAKALPIIAILSFSIGVVIAYQMGNQLRYYGADIFIVNFMGLSILREFGPLLTAILVGGRTGSSFTAQLGIMKINNEIDALTTMGIAPAEILLIPRIAALFIVVPLLTVWADIFGIVGGMIMAKNMLGIGWHDFLMRFQHTIPARSLIIGIAKAPIFALMIASVSCFQGLKVHGSAESVGARTTKSVVLSIFLIITFDSIISVLLSRYGL